MPGIELIRTLLEQASVRASRSNALHSLGWLIALVLAGAVGSFAEHAPAWFTIILAVVLLSAVAAYLGAYLYLLKVDRDALRSERFTLSKMAIEKSVTGDDVAGFLTEESKALLPPSSKTDSERKP